MSKLTVAQLFGAQGPTTQAPVLNPGAPAAPMQNAADTSSQLQQQQQQNMQNAPAGNQPVDKSPLAEHVKLWDNAKDDKGNDIIVSENPFDTNLFKPVDAKSVREQLSSRNFAGDVAPEMVQKILQGDATALTELLNNTTQNAVAQVLTMVPTLIEGGVKTYHDRASAALPTQMKRMSASQQLAGLNKEYQHPALRPFVEAATQQYLNKNPDATPDQIAASVNNYMGSVGQVLANRAGGSGGDPALQAGLPQAKEEHWGDFFGG